MIPVGVIAASQVIAKVATGVQQEATNYFAAMTEQPSTADKSKINDFIITLKNNNIWSNLYSCFLFGSFESTNLQGALINACAPTGASAQLITTGTAATLVGKSGISTTATGVISLNQVPSNYPTRNFFIGHWRTGDVRNGGFEVGVSLDDNFGGLYMEISSTVYYAHMVQSESSAGRPSVSTGFYVVQRDAGCCGRTIRDHGADKHSLSRLQAGVFSKEGGHLARDHTEERGSSLLLGLFRVRGLGGFRQLELREILRGALLHRRRRRREVGRSLQRECGAGQCGEARGEHLE
ncbi:MAG: hypothetical protein EOO77_29930 [Oxalobacteraceae bacterium]|nr:MAG: hypothetical protein EOO77_29930 [Oxalobacteraceae bacterium]